jgi:hypothetical protein
VIWRKCADVVDSDGGALPIVIPSRPWNAKTALVFLLVAGLGFLGLILSPLILGVALLARLIGVRIQPNPIAARFRAPLVHERHT